MATKAVWTKIGSLWRTDSEKAKAAGVKASGEQGCALPVVLGPGAQLVLKVNEDKKPGDTLPDFYLFVARAIVEGKDPTKGENDDDLPF